MQSTITATKVRYPITVVHSPHMPAASKFTDKPIAWAEVRDIVRANDLDAFARSKQTTEKYLAFKQKLTADGTTVFRHLLTHTLQWRREEDVRGLKDNEITVVESGSPLFTNPADLKIVLNDFPYYFEDDVVHMCVWTKKPIKSDPNSMIGDISPSTRATVDRYVQQTFVDQLGLSSDNVVWFRNWDALQSVKEISHIHVVVKGMTKE